MHTTAFPATRLSGLTTDFLNFLRSVFQNHYMIRSMIVRDIRARYSGSVVGIFWSVIHPITQLMIYYFVFSVILQVKLGPEYGGTEFVIWLVAGLLPWLFFAEVVTRSPTAVLEQAGLITKTVFPTEILPLAQLGAALINHLIGMGIFIIALIIFWGGISLQLLFIIPTMVGIGLFALGMSWLLSALNVFLRDIGQVIGVFVNIWFFLTPIIYPGHLIPEHFQTLYRMNPMLHAVEGYRMALLGTSAIEIDIVMFLLVPGVVMCVVGGLVFRKLKPAFADVL